LSPASAAQSSSGTVPERVVALTSHAPHVVVSVDANGNDGVNAVNDGCAGDLLTVDLLLGSAVDRPRVQPPKMSIPTADSAHRLIAHRVFMARAPLMAY
jgi:hypothetical protein